MVRVVAKRANELMCIILDEPTKFEVIEWIDQDFVDTDSLEIPDNSSKTEDTLPTIMSLEGWFEPVWTEL